ncbi:hydrolase 1, exosortase A system-associated [Novosphingobium sp. FKTRR1]|uniref:hydrolase 1, exosortase A system-associated n=1 Tax=Novosphingobium sp. FKTRR1 TaxID=2879118 RepID=UPI001CF078CC
MNRRHLTFACEGAQLAATLDSEAATGMTGLLIVSGGNEVRAGSWGGQAQLAARLAANGVPVFRFDRRGIGQSEGANRGFRASKPDIAAAIAAFRAATPQVRRLVAFGNCDAASALMLFGADLGIDALVLANPWTFDADTAPSHSAADLRSRYLARLANPRALWRLISGEVDLRRLAGGLKQAIGTVHPNGSALAADIAAGLARYDGPATILLADEDRTARAFFQTWPAGDPRVITYPTASHSFADRPAFEWLVERLVEATAARH